MNSRGRFMAKQQFFAKSRARANALADQKKQRAMAGKIVPDPETVEDTAEVTPGEVLPDPEEVVE